MIDSEGPRILYELDALLRTSPARVMVAELPIELVRKLHDSVHDLVWVTVPLERWERSIDVQVRSSWVFLLRKGLQTGPERHPNSRQRMMSFHGSGNFPFKREIDDPWTDHWVTSDFSAPLERRWVSIEPNCWHQGIVDDGQHWCVVSFQIAVAEALIEERPGGSHESPCIRRRYVDGT